VERSVYCRALLRKKVFIVGLFLRKGGFTVGLVAEGVGYCRARLRKLVFSGNWCSSLGSFAERIDYCWAILREESCMKWLVSQKSPFMYVCVYIHIYMYMYIYMYLYVYVYIYTYIYM